MPPKREPKKKPEQMGIATVGSLYKPDEAAIVEKVVDQYKTYKGITHSLGKMFATYGKGQKFICFVCGIAYH